MTPLRMVAGAGFEPAWLYFTCNVAYATVCQSDTNQQLTNCAYASVPWNTRATVEKKLKERIEHRSHNLVFDFPILKAFQHFTHSFITSFCLRLYATMRNRFNYLRIGVDRFFYSQKD